jgi:colanic acid/amylovoran biosynthesis protein
MRDHVRLDDTFHPPRELLARLREFDIVIATRMHMAILALCAGVPVVPIAYEFKTSELFRALGLDQWVHDIETVRGEALIRSVDTLIGDLAGVRARVVQVAQRERQRAMESGWLTASAVRAEARGVRQATGTRGAVRS